jgi:hypothetical protein
MRAVTGLVKIAIQSSVKLVEESGTTTSALQFNNQGLQSSVREETNKKITSLI